MAAPPLTRKIRRWHAERWLRCGLLLAAMLAALSVWLIDPAPLKALRNTFIDQYQRSMPRPYLAQAKVRVVDIDTASLDVFGQWPWPRVRVAALIEKLRSAGARVIALDVLLAESDRTSPAAAANLWQDTDPGISARLRHLPDHDTLLASAIEGRPVVLGASLSHVEAEEGRTIVIPSNAPFRWASIGDGKATPWLHDFDHATWPLRQFIDVAPGLGVLNFVPDADSVVRRVPLVLRLGDQPIPSLTAEALRVEQQANPYVIKVNKGGIEEVRIGRHVIPTNDQAEMWLHYTRPEPGRFVSAHQVLRDQLDPNLIKDHIVLVGTSAPGLMDLRMSPQGRIMSGVEAHAQALEQVLLGHFLTRPTWAVGSEATVLVLGGLAVGVIALSAPAWVSALFTLALLGALLGGAWYLFGVHHLVLDAASPAALIFLVYVLTSGMHHLVSERQQRWVREAFSRYVSPNRVAHLVANPEELELGGRRQMCSFVFTDLQGFTSLLERMDPGEAVAHLNEYLEKMVSIAFKHEGTLDRIVGDAVVVMFSAPVEQTDHRQRALDCALDMDAFASRYALQLRATGVAWGMTRVGVHCGEVIVGNFGGKALFDYRALGDPINTAARLESVNKHLGTRMCVSRDVLDGCKPCPARSVGRLVLKGKSRPLAVAEPEASVEHTGAERAPLADYQAAMALLEGGAPAAARDLFEELAARHPHDPLVKLHLARLREGCADDLIVLDAK